MPQKYTVDVAADTTLVTTAETVVATLTGVATPRPGMSVRLHGSYVITLGTNTTAVTTRVRRDSLTGTLVDEAITEQISSAAGSSEGHEIVVTDTGQGELAGATYVLTVAQTAASANGSVLHASLEAEPF